MRKIIDLHTHSNRSDGTLTPTELMHLAAEKNISSIALTDHDTTAGISEAAAEADLLGIELIPGIEFSAYACNREVHIVGLDLNIDDPLFVRTVGSYRQRRENRNTQIIARMRQDGYDVSEALLKERYGEAVITRAHFARYLMEEGAAASIKEAFDRYLGENCAYYVSREKIPAHEAVALIASNGGIPILAHPFQYHLGERELIDLLRDLKSAGLIGIEAYYSTHSLEQTRMVLALTRRLGLCPSGGSDFHGSNKPHIQLGTGMGNLQIEETILENMRNMRHA